MARADVSSDGETSFFWCASRFDDWCAVLLSSALSFLIQYPNFLFERESFLFSCLWFFSNLLRLDVNQEVVRVIDLLTTKASTSSSTCVFGDLLFSSGDVACSEVLKALFQLYCCRALILFLKVLLIDILGIFMVAIRVVHATISGW